MREGREGDKGWWRMTGRWGVWCVHEGWCRRDGGWCRRGERGGYAKFNKINYFWLFARACILNWVLQDVLWALTNSYWAYCLLTGFLVSSGLVLMSAIQPYLLWWLAFPHAWHNLQLVLISKNVSSCNYASPPHTSKWHGKCAWPVQLWQPDFTSIPKQQYNKPCSVHSSEAPGMFTASSCGSQAPLHFALLPAVSLYIAYIWTLLWYGMDLCNVPMGLGPATQHHIISTCISALHLHIYIHTWFIYL